MDPANYSNTYINKLSYNPYDFKNKLPEQYRAFVDLCEVLPSGNLSVEGEDLKCSASDLLSLIEKVSTVQSHTKRYRDNRPVQVQLNDETDCRCIIQTSQDVAPRVFLIVDRIIGEGSFSYVKPAYELGSNDFRKAIKIYREDLDEGSQLKKLRGEVEALKAIYDKNVRGIQPPPDLVCELEPSYTSKDSLADHHWVIDEPFKAIITKRFDHNLWDDFKGERSDRTKIINRLAASISQPIDIGLQLFEPLAHVHALDHAHGDIKPDNIFVEMPDKLILSDWNLSQRMGPTGEAPSFKRASAYANEEDLKVRTRAWSTKDAATYKSVMPAMDIYAMSLVYYQVLLGEARNLGKPEREKSWLDQKGLIERGVRAPERLFDLLWECRQTDYKLRPSAAQIVDRLKKVKAEDEQG